MKRSLWQIAFTCVSVLATSSTASAYFTNGTQQKVSAEGNLLKTTAGCKPATASIDLDINNVRARVMTGGDMWYNTGTGLPSYEIPKGSQRHSLFAGSCWIGGIDGNGALKVSAQLFRSNGNDYWPGPIDKATKDITAASCSEWDRMWKVNASVLQDFRQAYKSGGASAITDEKFRVIKEWPAAGNTDARGSQNNSLPELISPLVDEYGYAPYVDVDGKAGYNWKGGDYPRAYGVEGSNPSQFIWWVFNDIGNTKTMTKTASIGMEVQTSAFAYSSTDFLNDATFYNYRLINRGNIVLDSCFIATWTDADLGSPFDDYIGCDTARGLGILYNGESPDQANGQNTYGTRIPMIGVDFFIGPRRDYVDEFGNNTFKLLSMSTFSYFEGTAVGPVRDPRTGPEFYNYMTGSNADGIPFSNDQSRGTSSVGYGIGPVAPFVFYGDPSISSEWSMCACKSPLKDRRFIHSSGPFVLQPGAKNDITIGVVWVDDAGACGTASFKKIRAADDIAQALFNDGFKRSVGPEAPVLTIREMDRKLICYISNPEGSNNYQERYGDPAFYSDDFYTIRSPKAKAVNSPDSVYRFEGYRVFQLRGPNVSIFDENGELTADAVQVFQTDRKNGVSQIANYTKNLEVKSPIDQYNVSIKVNGKDSGLVHSFVLTEDAFASGDKTLVNYKTYYYQIVAYAYNNFAPFDPHNEVNTQDKAYLIGDNGPGQTAIARYPAMPNPMNQHGDTFTHSSYGDGVIVTRIEGIGNGGLDVQMDDTSEISALMNNQVPYPTYKVGRGPITVKVIDPVKVVDADWRIAINGNVNDTDANMGIVDTATWRIEKLNSDGSVADVIYSEKNISVSNEQILANYGLSVAINQVVPPGVDQVNGNGYISSDITFENTALPWLSGVKDESGVNVLNWIRSGSFEDPIVPPATTPPCGPFDDYLADTNSYYNTMLSNNTNVTSTWAPYDLANAVDGNTCGFSPAADASTGTGTKLYYSVEGGKGKQISYSEIPNVDLVFTSDKSKWTRCVVLEAQNSNVLSEGGAARMTPRSHKSWNLAIDADGLPVYSTVANDTGFSYFPGYAINQITGERLNIAFSEDSYLKRFNGGDMIWNPTTDIVNNFGETIFGGKHFTYILRTKYDSCKSFIPRILSPSAFVKIPAYREMRWVGIPLLNQGAQLLSLRDGLIPTETRMRFRVNTAFKPYKLMEGQTAVNNQNPLYKFSTKGMSTTDYTKSTDGDALLDRIFAVPNPYKGQASGGNTYEANRLETKIKIINLPKQASINIYSLDGTLVRHLEKDNNDPAISWDLFNQAGLPIASGMYLIHVRAYGKDRVLRWFGAMRPLDVTNN